VLNALRGLTALVAARLLGGLVADERGARRFRLAGMAIGANVVAKGLAFAVILYSTRVALDHLGAERFGVWMTLSSVAILLSFVDLGLSNALVTRVAQLVAGGPAAEHQRYVVSAGLLALCALGVVTSLALIAVFAVAPLDAWFRGAQPAVLAEARATGYAFAILFGLSLPAQGLYKIYAGLQQAWLAHVASSLGYIVSLVLLAVSRGMDAPMWFYLFATFGVQQLASVLLVSGVARRGLLHPPWRGASGVLLSTLREDALVRQGQMFLLIQIAVAVVWGSNQLILSAVIGSSEAAAFSVAQRLFMVVVVALTVVNVPLWAIYADAKAGGEHDFIRGTLQRSMTLTFACAVGAVILLLAASEPLVSFLTNDRVAVSNATLRLMALWTILEVSGNAFAMYLNGVGAIRPQALTAVAYMLTSVPLKIAGAYYFGLDGLLAVMIASYVAFTVIPLLTIFRGECLAALRAR
jgi:O-antigen/teichoic acid export membrane protein